MDGRASIVVVGIPQIYFVIVERLTYEASRRTSRSIGKEVLSKYR